ncbi:MAG: hypothetical protein ACREFU_14975 [Acetobacteraceae bacterium]
MMEEPTVKAALTLATAAGCDRLPVNRLTGEMVDAPEIWSAADMLRNHSVEKHETPAEHDLEGQMATLQLQLIRSDDPKARTKLLDSLLEAGERFRYDGELLPPALA